MAKSKISKKRILTAVDGCNGIISVVARKLQVDWHVARNAIERYPEAKLAYESEKEKVLDLGESKIITAINNSDIPTIKWYMSKKGKERGYGDDPITINNTVNSTVKSALPNISTEALEQIDAIIDGEATEEDKKKDKC